MLKVNLSTISAVKNFTHIAAQTTAAITLKSDKYVVDGKSIMGIFSLDLSKPITVEIEPVSMEDEFKELAKEFLVD